jgi:hypothetical protein
MTIRPWSDRETARLFQLRGKRLKWPEIATALPGRSANACQGRYYWLKTRDRAPAPAIAPAMGQAKAIEPSGAVMSLATLLADAELRSRIAIQGVSAGLLGDPMPGRSALDQKRSIPAAADPKVDRRSGSPKPTLATGPMR